MCASKARAINSARLLVLVDLKAWSILDSIILCLHKCTEACTFGAFIIIIVTLSTDKKIEIWKVDQVDDVPLGRGSYGDVVKVTYKNKEYAAKKIRAHLVHDSVLYTRKAMEECHILRSLSHRNIVQYCNLGKLPEKDSLPVLVMELMEKNLHQYLLETSKNAISITKKKRFLNDVANGLHYLHSKNVWHRDLTAKNVLLDKEETAKISDFGNARVVDSDCGYTQSALTANPGHSAYMPPEAARKKYSSKIDVFSFGHLGLFVLVQEFPEDLLDRTYEDENGDIKGYSEVERRQMYFAKIPPHQDTDQMVELVKHCLSYSPEKRPNIAHIIANTQ